MHCKNLFWVENLKELFCDFRIIPMKANMSREAYFNTWTRLIILIFVALLLFLDTIFCVAFLIIAISALIILYYNKKNKMKENFTVPVAKISNYINDRPSGYVWCDDAVPVPYDDPKKMSVIPNNLRQRVDGKLKPSLGTYLTVSENQAGNTPISNYQSMNQRLAGGANPKTLIPPVVIPPIMDLEYWKTNNLVTHSSVNTLKQIDDYQSGYQVSTCCGSDDTPMRLVDDEAKLYSHYKTKRITSGGYKKNNYQANVNNSVKDYIENNERFTRKGINNVRENFAIKGPDAMRRPESISEVESQPFDAGFKLPKALEGERIILPTEIKEAESGQVNTACGYNPSQLYTSSLPTNFPSTKCERSPYLNSYHDDLFTQTIQPGVYSKNQVNEPINSNIGISFDQQLEPLTIRDNGDNSITFTRHDPRIMGDIIEEPQLETVNEANVYDPRYSGYGTSYRAYDNELLGRTDFYYDDIDAVRMPNYIARNNIDFAKFADTYGPMKTASGNPYTEEIRNLANNQFLSSALEFRTGLSESLMRKNNAEGWQKRAMPLNLSMR